MIQRPFMNSQRTVLLAGGTGRTGSRVLQQLLDRGVFVRAIVRTPEKLPPEIVGHPHLTLIQTALLSLDEAELQQHVRGCDAAISCLGHVLSLKGIFGHPRDLVARATMRLCGAVQALQPPAPVKYILMTSVSVNRPDRQDARRNTFERAFLRAMCSVLPPAMDNQRAADFLLEKVPPTNPFLQWVVVRPDSLLEGGITDYALSDGLVDSVFSPGSTNMANIAHFMCDLVTNENTWNAWRGKLPVIVNVPE